MFEDWKSLDSRYFDHYSKVQGYDWPWTVCTPMEMACPETGTIIVVRSFMDRLEALHHLNNVIFRVLEGYRTPDYNDKISKTGLTGPHTIGKAVHLRVTGEDALRIIPMALSLGFTGFGLHQHGPIKNHFIHLDDLKTKLNLKRPDIWTYDE